MESMEFNYYPQSLPQQYSYIPYASGNGALPRDEVANVAQSMETSLEHNYISASYDNYGQFEASMLANIPLSSTSPPAPGHALSTHDHALGLDLADQDIDGRRGSSEEKESMTPAQSRRKAQNRAAQRAFRERKERHVRDLEAKLTLLTNTTSSLQSDNERLKLLLQRAQTENEILRATQTGSTTTSRHPSAFVDEPSLLARQQSLQRATSLNSSQQSLYSSSAAASRLAASYPGSDASATFLNGRQFGTSPTTESNNLLSATATWDFIQSHPLYLSGTVDIAEVCERLKMLSRTEGMGPVFDEDEVRKIVEEVGKCGGDDLI